MAYYLFDSDGQSLGQVFSAGGMRAALDEASNSGDMPATDAFLNGGVCESDEVASAIIEECANRPAFSKLVDTMKGASVPLSLENDTMADGEDQVDDAESEDAGSGAMPDQEEIDAANDVLKSEEE